jgi:hypothetical protein
MGHVLIDDPVQGDHLKDSIFLVMLPAVIVQLQIFSQAVI